MGNNQYIDKLFLEEVEKIANSYGVKVTYSNANIRHFWLDCDDDDKIVIPLVLEIRALIIKFRRLYPNFEEEKIITEEGWPTDIGEITK